MESYLRRGYIEFLTLSPVFIGSGKELNKKEYIYDRNTGSICLVDFRKMCEGLQSRKLIDAFESYLMEDVEATNRKQGGYPRQNRELIHFLRDNRVPEAAYKNWYIGSVKVADNSMNMHSAKSIQMFMRNAQGRPFVPGSSFKGMLRTILETRYFLEHRDEANEIADSIHAARKQNRNRYLSDEDKMIDVKSMHREMFEVYKNNPEKSLADQNNDMLRGLLVGDSEPLSLDDMCICQKIDLTVRGEQRPLNLVRECIKPGVVVRVPITIDTSVCSFTMKDILAAMEEYYKNYISQFSSHFTGCPPTRGNKTTFYLGGGAGYLSKTVTYGIMHGAEAVRTTAEIIDQTLPPKVRDMHKHHLDLKKGVSPHLLKCTLYRGSLCQMGACCVKRYV